VILAKSTTGAACADLIKQATSAAGVYTFTALLECQYVQNVSSLAPTNDSSLEQTMKRRWIF
jgi:hypothetical protein